MIEINDTLEWTMFEACRTYEVGYSEENVFPKTLEPVWMLGNKYSTLYDMNDIISIIVSKVWMTYRKNFPAIGGTGPTSDSGWGCMLRCGQMVLAETLLNRHLGRGWKWTPGCRDPVYWSILQMFQDKKDSLYSLHQIAQMGASEGKVIGQWFGPNTIAQVLKKLSVYDTWSSLVIHIAMDNAVCIDDIKLLCTRRCKSPVLKNTDPLIANQSIAANGRINIDSSVVVNKKIKRRSSPKQTFVDGACGSSNSVLYSPDLSVKFSSNREDSGLATPELTWKPLLLFIPLRLGLSELNPVYVNSLKTCFKLKYCVGIIGGKPNHALYFIGFVGDDLLYLDPHTTQQTANHFDPECDESAFSTDETYHCQSTYRMNVHNVDPSIALCFFCESEAEFNDMCSLFHKFLIEPESQPMFEMCKERPAHWPPLEQQSPLDPEITVEEWPCDTSDDEFVLLG